MKQLLIVLALAFFFAACSSEQHPKTIYIVRHAEKELTGNDPELSVAGKARAVKLSQILAEEGITHVFSTDYNRTRLTAAPTASAAGIEIETYEPKNQDALSEQLKSLEGNILVVGHSNTVGQVANYFVGDGDKYQDLEDSEYNFIYVVTLDKEGNSSVVRKTYKDY